MASLKMNIPHELPKEEAYNRIQTLLRKVKQQFGDKISNLKEEWNGEQGRFHFSVMGFDVSGLLTVKDSQVDLDGKIPFAASFFKGKIKSVISEEANKILRKDISSNDLTEVRKDNES